MDRQYHRWYSPSLNRDMELLAFGHGGARVLVFPTSLGRFFEWEDRGMIQVLGDYVRNGWLQIFCVDSVDAESWYAKDKHPGERAWRHMQYEQYILNEVVPLTWQLNQTPFLIATGASFGAYHAVNLAFRHPNAVSRVIGMSGMYDIKTLTGGYEDHNVYQNDPSHYMLHLSDHDQLEAIRRQSIILATGQTDPHIENNKHLSGVLWNKGIWHALRLWDGWSHDWPYWRQMIRLYINGAD
ncbi:MAG: esterase family protein [Gemmatimonadota bacterium]